MYPEVTFRATYECYYWPDDGQENPWTWHGYCDPCNPWGTLNDDVPAAPSIWGTVAGDEPIEYTLPIWQAAEFIANFPGGVWDLQWECQPDQNYRTGVYSDVTLHMDGDGAEAAMVIATDIRERRKAAIAAIARRLA